MLFELLLALAGYFVGVEQFGEAGFFAGWIAVRLYLSPFLKFALPRSWALLVASGAAFALGFSVCAGPSAADRLFLVTVLGILGTPLLALFHLWQLPHFRRLFADFAETQERRGPAEL